VEASNQNGGNGKLLLNMPETCSAGGNVHEIKQGTPVKRPAYIRAIMTEALHRIGEQSNLSAVDWIIRHANASHQNGRAFLSDVMKLVPIELSGPGGAELTVIIKKETGELYEGSFKEGKLVTTEVPRGVSKLVTSIVGVHQELGENDE
jgi:hypothetical protein